MSEGAQPKTTRTLDTAPSPGSQTEVKIWSEPRGENTESQASDKLSQGGEWSGALGHSSVEP